MQIRTSSYISTASPKIEYSDHFIQKSKLKNDQTITILCYYNTTI